MDDFEGEDWQSTHFNSRHIAHSRTKNSSRSKASGKNSAIFDPHSSYGLYEIICPALTKLAMGPLVTSGLAATAGSGITDSPHSAASLGSSPETWSAAPPNSPGPGLGLASSPGAAAGKKGKKGKGNSRRGSKEDRIVAAVGRGIAEARFEIHGGVEGDGNEGALLCSFDLGGVVHGMAVLAGSRRLLTRVVSDLDGEYDDDDDEEQRDREMEAASVASTMYDSDGEEIVPLANDIEEADERERRRIAAFEKNSFRTPKFWMRWKGVVAGEGSAGLGGVDGNSNGVGERLFRSKSGRTVEVNTGYLVFSGNDCARFSGTFSCQALGWKNVKITGSKLVSKARDCPLEWSEIGAGR